MKAPELGAEERRKVLKRKQQAAASSSALFRVLCSEISTSDRTEGTSATCQTARPRNGARGPAPFTNAGTDFWWWFIKTITSAGRSRSLALSNSFKLLPRAIKRAGAGGSQCYRIIAGRGERGRGSGREKPQQYSPEELATPAAGCKALLPGGAVLAAAAAGEPAPVSRAEPPLLPPKPLGTAAPAPRCAAQPLGLGVERQLRRGVRGRQRGGSVAKAGGAKPAHSPSCSCSASAPAPPAARRSTCEGFWHGGLAGYTLHTSRILDADEEEKEEG
ncbi:uncharacterized protein LOC122464278 [Chelonia mydas]|uniref:uncharacterized protein LOC122464278 n=1 Tax=Chelonia mydas TaxID=8469 RepID=UPI001CA87494|nr:uncharacterized protein LOC122464278 [Chelonia mydas]